MIDGIASTSLVGTPKLNVATMSEAELIAHESAFTPTNVASH